ncbi:MAG: DUF92 domain-containing protein [Ignavibacteria bacterium]
MEKILISVLAGLFIVLISLKFKFLTRSGALATFILAVIIFSLGGIKWSVPVFTFFIFSSLLSKLKRKTKSNSEIYFEKTSTRDHWQVLANGGLGAVFLIADQFVSLDLFYFLYVSSFAAVCLDTWSTEIGTMFKTKTYNVLSLKKIDQGKSGGISVIGFAGGFAGVLLLSFSGYYWINNNGIYYLLIIIISGMLGNLFDSVMGAALQSRYKCIKCLQITEKRIHCQSEAELERGYRWINNDFVNFSAALFSSGITLILYNCVY